MLASAHAAPSTVTIDTHLLAGTQAQLAFDLIDGGVPANSVTISGFTTDGILGVAVTVGAVSGTLASSVLLEDSAFFSEHLQTIVLGNSISFVYESSGHAPAVGSLPDGFSLYLLNNTGQALALSDDPSGSNALMLDNIGSALGMVVYNSAQVGMSVAVPEPSSFALALIGLVFLLMAARRARLWMIRAISVCLAMVAGAAWSADVSDRVTVTSSGFVFNRSTNTYDTTATLKNVSAVSVGSAITLEISSLSSPSITLANSAGTNANNLPFVNIAGDLAPGAQKTALLKFSNPQRVALTFKSRVFGVLPAVNGLPDMVAAPMTFFINTPTQVRFQAQVPPSGLLDTASVKLYRANVAGKPTGNALCTLRDNGLLGNGDDIANDNVYSCFVTLNSATADNVRLVVSATIGGAAAASPVLIINIVDKLDPALAQLVIDTQATAEVIAKQMIANLGDTLAARQAAVASILQQPGVQSAGVSSDSTTIWIRYSSGIDGGLMLNPPGTRGSTGDAVAVSTGRAAASRVPAALVTATPAAFPRMRPFSTPRSAALRAALAPPAMSLPPTAAAPQTNIGNTNVLIWDAYNSQFAPFDEGPGLQALFTAAQCPLYNVTYLKDAQATVASVRSFTGYGTIVLVTHGAVDGNGDVVFLTRETNTLAAMLSNSIDLLLGRIMVMGNVFAIRPSFITSLAGAMPDAVVYNGSCQSSANATMSSAFTAKGAKTYYGYTRVVNSDFAQTSATQLFNSLVTSLKTTGESFTPIAPKVDPKTPFATFTQSGDIQLAYTGDLQNGDFEKGNLASWTTTGDGRVITGLGPFAPTEGSYAGLVSSGLGFTTASGAIEQNFCLAKTATQLKFDWNFSSEEFIEWCGTQFDDRFEVVLETSTGSTTLFQRSINGLCHAAIAPTALAFDRSGPGCVPTPADVGFGTGGNDCKVWSTGWSSQVIDISGIAATNGGKGVKLRFRAADVGDSDFDSAILLDKIIVVRP